MKKTYVLDTNVLLTDTNSINAFEDNEVVIPLTVIEELDNQKRRQDEVGGNARTVCRKLDKLRQEGALSSVKGVKLPNGGNIRILPSKKSELDIPADLDKDKADNTIIAFMKTLKPGAILVSRDINVRLKCDALGIKCQDYINFRAADNEDALYSGVQVIENVADEIIDLFYSDGSLENISSLFPNEVFYPNQIVVLKTSSQGKTSKSALSRHINNFLVALRPIKDAAGFTPRNKEQQFALDLLFDDDIKLITLVSKAGTGKTSLALAAGLAQLSGFADNDEAKYTKLIVSRPVMPLGKDIGFLPGTLEEKMAPWIAPVKDALNFLLGEKKPRPISKKGGELSSNTYLQMMQEKGIIEVEALAFIRGRSIPNAYIIIDESQNLSKHEIKTILTRAGEGTKIVLTGDIQQIDNTHVDALSNGLTYAVEKFKDQSIAGHISLIKGERSSLASLAAEIL